MEKYHIRTWGDPILRQKCKPVEDFSDLDELIKAMKSIVSQYSNAGIAAPQIGDSRQVILKKVNGDTEIFVNPHIEKASGYLPFLEECISLPWMIVPKIRRYSIDVEYQNTEGEHRQKTFIGLDAVILQHEIDHLNGKLMYQFFKKI